MTKHRTITGFVAVALLAVAATAATMRSRSPWTDGIVVSGTTLLKGLTVDANKLPTADFDDRWSAMSALPPTTQTAERGLDVR
jgi:putative intracellular protease/amidase